MAKKVGQKASLKATLQTHQSRVQKKQKIAQAALVAEQKGVKKSHHNKNDKGKAKAAVSRETRQTIPFHPTDQILLIGEGNFSFARSLVDPDHRPAELEFLPAINITATAYDSEAECYGKYPDAEEIVAGLKAKGVQVLFGVDAGKLNEIKAFKGKKFHKIVWNFPHAGMGISDQDRNILTNQLLLLSFLRSASTHLSLGPVPIFHKPRKRKGKQDDMEEDEKDAMVSDEEDAAPAKSRGTLLITLRNVVPYTLWDLPRLAKSPPAPTSSTASVNVPYTLLRSFVFHRKSWHGYEHRMTKGERAHGTGKTGEGGEDRMWEFCLKDVDKT